MGHVAITRRTELGELLHEDLLVEVFLQYGIDPDDWDEDTPLVALCRVERIPFQELQEELISAMSEADVYWDGVENEYDDSDEDEYDDDDDDDHDDDDDDDDDAPLRRTG